MGEGTIELSRDIIIIHRNQYALAIASYPGPPFQGEGHCMCMHQLYVPKVKSATLYRGPLFHGEGLGKRYLTYQIFMVRLACVHAVVNRPFSAKERT